MVIALLAPGSSVHTVRWAKALAGRGHEVHLLTQHPPAAGLEVHVKVHLLPHYGGVGYLVNGYRLRLLLSVIKPDVVNAHYATGYGTLARGAKGYPVVLNVWGSDVFEFPEISSFHRAWLLGNLRHADQLVSTSHIMAERTAGLGRGLPPITVVPFGVDTGVFTPNGNDESACGMLVVGTVKSLAPAYGVDRLIQAFAQLRGMNELPRLRLRIVGEGPDRESLERLARKLGIADLMDMVGAVPHALVPNELHKLSVYVALSRSESFGVAVAEASACGIPVVVSDAGGLPEVVQEGITGFVIPGGSPTVAARRIHQLLVDPGLRERMGKAGRVLIGENYEMSQCVDRMIDVLHRAAGKLAV